MLDQPLPGRHLPRGLPGVPSAPPPRNALDTLTRVIRTFSTSPRSASSVIASAADGTPSSAAAAWWSTSAIGSPASSTKSCLAVGLSCLTPRPSTKSRVSATDRLRRSSTSVWRGTPGLPASQRPTLTISSGLPRQTSTSSSSAFGSRETRSAPRWRASSAWPASGASGPSWMGSTCCGGVSVSVPATTMCAPGTRVGSHSTWLHELTLSSRSTQPVPLSASMTCAVASWGSWMPPGGRFSVRSTRWATLSGVSGRSLSGPRRSA
ncbi:hypothetical protein ACFQ0B_06250 [Nonomuraea thailandensis]